MTIDLRPATESDVREFASWRYDAPYDVYDINMSLNDAAVYFLEPDIHCQALRDGDNLVGYCTYGQDARVPGGNYKEGGLDIGLGIKPGRTGSGEGSRFVAAVVAFTTEAFEPRRLRVTIAAGNVRTLRVWSSAGFAEISRFSTPRTMMGSNEFAILAFESTATDVSSEEANKEI